MAKYKTPQAAPAAKFSSEPEYDRSQITNKLNISVGTVCKGIYEPVETDGIKIRGTGAATKGVKARGPMA